MVIGFISVLTEPLAPWMRIFAASFFAAFFALLVWLLVMPYRTLYELSADFLTIRMGPFKQVIPIADITAAYPTHNPLSAPAWSLDRVRIKTRTSRFGALIAPESQYRFLSELDSLAPQLERQGERLVLSAREHGS
jgi:hypothetical protein